MAGISKEIERTWRQRLGAESAEGLPPVELLARYLESKGTPPDRIRVLLQYAGKILSSGE